MQDTGELTQLYKDVFAGRCGYIPLIVACPCPGGPSVEALWKDTSPAVRQACQAQRPRVEIGSDWIPTVNIGAYQSIAIPSLFGAPIAETGGGEPICEASFATVAEILDLGRPALEGPVIDDLLVTARAAAKARPEGFGVSLPPSGSPWDLAQVMLGANILLEMYDDPDGTLEMLEMLADLYIELVLCVREIIGEPYVTNRGIPLPGHRTPADAIVNLSPEMLRQFVLPVLDRLGTALGPICLHYCTSPAPSGHVLPVLLESEAILAVDNWQGSEVFWGAEAPAADQARIAILGDSDLTTPEKMDAFLASPAVTGVPRTQGRAIVRQTFCASTEEGQQIYQEWTRRMSRMEQLP